MKGDTYDPKALIREAYRIEGITNSECRSIFVDWALSLSDVSTDAALAVLIERHGVDQADHPMTHVLQEGLTTAMQPPRRRGGWRSRRE